MGKKLKLKDLPPQSLDVILAEHPRGREFSIVWARALAITGDETYQKFVAAWEKDKGKDERPLEVYCEAAGITPGEYYGMFASHMLTYANQKIEMIKFAELPEVVRASYQMARTPDGFQDRTAILKHEGQHFAPQANQININQGVNVQGGYQAMSDFTAELEKLEMAPRELPAATTEFVNGTIVHEEENELVNR